MDEIIKAMNLETLTQEQKKLLEIHYKTNHCVPIKEIQVMATMDIFDSKLAFWLLSIIIVRYCGRLNYNPKSLFPQQKQGTLPCHRQRGRSYQWWNIYNNWRRRWTLNRNVQTWSVKYSKIITVRLNFPRLQRFVLVQKILPSNIITSENTFGKVWLK